MTSPRIALVTGANKGIGLEIARQLSGEGVEVLMGARDAARGQEAAELLKSEGLSVQFLQLDVTDPPSITAAVQSIERNFGRLDILVNNAGIALEISPPSESSMDVLRQTFETNFFGLIALTQALLPLLQKSEGGRIVNMSSELGSLTLTSDVNTSYYAYNAFSYGATKTALNAFTVSLAKELRDSKIKVNSVTPGYVATDLNHHQGFRTVEQGAREPVRLALLPEDGPNGGFFDDNGELPW